ncbi:MAG: TlpA family protein disulfide reductase [Methylobacter sp.]
MMLEKIFLNALFVCLAAFNTTAQAAPSAFIAGSYQQILASNAGRPFVLVIWSVNCPSCLKEMALLERLHQDKPELKMILLAADEPSEAEQIQQILAKNQLSGIESWAYADENIQRLQFEIDPAWYGELPRTYFFNKAHQRTGVSGVLTKEDYETMFGKIMD